MSRPSSSRLLVLGSLLLMSLGASQASAREFSRSEHLTGPQGRSVMRESFSQAENSSLSRHRSVQGSAGRGYVRETDRECLQGVSCSRSVSGSTNSGRQWSRNTQITHDEEDGFSSSQSASGPRGANVQRETQFSR